MAITLELLGIPAGLTGLVAKLYPEGSDTIANGAGGDALTYATNRTGYMSATVAEDLSGIHTVHVEDGSANLIFVDSVFLEGDGTTARNVRKPFLDSNGFVTPANDYPEGYVWIRRGGTAGTTVGVNGTLNNPVGALGDAYTIASARGRASIKFLPAVSGIAGSYATPVLAPTEDFVLDLNGMYLSSANNLDFSTFGGETILSSIEGGTLATSGTYTCGFGGYYENILWQVATSLEIDNVRMRHCIFESETAKIAPVKDTIGDADVLYACSFLTDPIIIDFVGCVNGHTVNLHDCWGNVEVQNLSGTQKLQYLGWGQVTLNANCTGGTLEYDSHIEVVDNSGNVTLNKLTSALEATDLDVYWADIKINVDEANTQDEYTVRWYKNGARVTSGITTPLIQVVNRVTGADLVASTAMTEDASTSGLYRYDEGTNRITAGDDVEAIATATIDGSARTFSAVTGRDSSA